MSAVDNFKDLVKPFFKTKKGKEYVKEAGSGKQGVIVNLDDLAEWRPDIAESLIVGAIKYGIKGFEQAFKEEVFSHLSSTVDPERIEIGFCGECIPFVKIRDIASKYVGQLIKIRGLVNRTGFIKPMYLEAVFKCRECGDYTQAILQESSLALSLPPKKCDFCKNRVTYDIVPEMSTFVDSQEFSVQELYEDISGGWVPRRVRMILFKKYLINKVRCGDLVEIVGVVRLQPSYRRTQKTRFNIPFIEVYSFEKKSKDPETIEINEADEEEILALAKQPDIYEQLIWNVAPSLYGMENSKEACLLALFGGVKKEKKDITIRGNIHVLMVGDPATGKSQLLQSVARLAPRGMYATGRGTTAAGLTASMNRDNETGEWMIDAGVLVLADKGVACIDEIEKMRPEDRVNIHEAMAQQTVTIDKAGLHATLMARTAVISAANPLMGRYAEDKSVLENIANFPPSLFSRFDLIFILIDKPREDLDTKVVRHIRDRSQKTSTIRRDLFRKYIAYAKRITPTLSEEAGQRLETYFLSVRKQINGDDKNKRIPITYRQFEALIRMCEARARILLKNEADIEDVKVIIKLFNKFLDEFDIDIMETGKTKTHWDYKTIIIGVLKEMQGDSGLTRKELIEEAHERGVPRVKVMPIIIKLLNEGALLQPSSGYYHTVF